MPTPKRRRVDRTTTQIVRRCFTLRSSRAQASADRTAPRAAPERREQPLRDQESEYHLAQAYFVLRPSQELHPALPRIRPNRGAASVIGPPPKAKGACAQARGQYCADPISGKRTCKTLLAEGKICAPRAPSAAPGAASRMSPRAARRSAARPTGVEPDDHRDCLCDPWRTHERLPVLALLPLFFSSAAVHPRLLARPLISSRTTSGMVGQAVGEQP